ncbi:C-type lectin domain family 2 member B-like isoform X2 [Lithobates pipiens]
MGLGEHKPVDDNIATKECLSPLTNGDPEKPANYNKQGTWQKLKSIKVPLIPVVVIIAILILAIIVAAAVPRTGEKSTTGTENHIYRYAACKDGWVYYRGKCYYFSEKRDTWNNSQSYCISNHSSLANIDSKEELDFLNRYKCKQNYWIGLSRVKDVSNWVWTNDTPYTETIFTIESLGTASGDLEHAFMNHDSVKSEIGRYDKQWICNQKLVLL